jgi:DHA2 family multidrug resistance protein
MMWEATFSRDVTFAMVVTQQLIAGMCISFFFAPGMSLCLGFLKPSEVAGGAGCFHFTRTLAMAFATSLTTTSWQNSTIRHHVAIADRFNSAAGMRQITAAGIAPAQALRYLENLVQSQSVMLAMVDVCHAFAVIMALGAMGIWLVPRPKAVAAAVH